MKLKLKVKRYSIEKKSSYWQTFTVEGDGTETVADLLRKVNEREPLVDEDGKTTTPIEWECGCMQKKCGGCAMVINGIPQLACNAFVADLGKKNSVINVEPLSKFPVIKDLRVDRSKLYKDLQEMKIWVNGQAQQNNKEWEGQYVSATCIMCGLCLEVCPNYTGDNAFTGAAVMNAAYRVATQQSQGSNRKMFIKENIKRGQGHCSKTLSCEDVCPMGIPTGSLMSRMNRLYIKDLLGFKK